MREKEGTYEMQIYCEELPRLSGWTQGGAAADVEGNGECYGGGGAPEAGRQRQEEDREREKNEEGRGKRIYKDEMRTDGRGNQGRTK